MTVLTEWSSGWLRMCSPKHNYTATSELREEAFPPPLFSSPQLYDNDLVQWPLYGVGRFVYIITVAMAYSNSTAERLLVILLLSKTL